MKIKELQDSYKKKKIEIKKRLEDFSRIRNEDIFYELCFCLLTPQSSAIAADKCIKELKKKDFKNSDFNPENSLRGIRFHKKKAKYIIEVKTKYHQVIYALTTIKDAKKLREWLVKNIKGYGYKEASHFLRNIGYKNITILDRHILKNLKNFGAIPEIPEHITKKKYLETEVKMKEFAKKVNIGVDELDLLFWSMETGHIFK